MKKNSCPRCLIKRAKTTLLTLIAENNKRLTNPDLFVPNTPAVSFPIYWNTKKFSKRDLIELVSAIEAAEALVYVRQLDTDGRQPPFAP